MKMVSVSEEGMLRWNKVEEGKDQKLMERTVKKKCTPE